MAMIACTSQPPVPQKQEPAPKQRYDWNNESWDAALVAAIDEHGLADAQPRDWKSYIATWPATKEGRIAFWAKILVVIAKYESSFNPESKYQEKFKSSSNGKFVVSRGLFQISKSSSEQARYNCKWKNEEELHDPLLNIDCATRIISYWVKQDSVISEYKNGAWFGPAKYFSTLRGITPHTKKALEAAKNANH